MHDEVSGAAGQGEGRPHHDASRDASPTDDGVAGSILYRPVPSDRPVPGVTAVELHLGGPHAVSSCQVVPVQLRIGAAVVRVDGIGEVGTHPEYRHRGYSRRVLLAALHKMAEGDAALSMLHGIPDFYPKFGYATAGPEYMLSLPLLAGPPALPAGWTSRPLALGDLPALHRLYDLQTARSVGAALRAPAAYPWTALSRLPASAAGDACRVVVAPAEGVVAYAWRCAEFWFVEDLAANHPDDFVVGEVMAGSPAAADAILVVCRRWAAEEDPTRRPATRVTLTLPPEGHVAAAAMYQHATFRQSHAACGDSMVRVLHVGRLLEALAPELLARLRAGSPLGIPSYRGALRVETEIGGASLTVAAGGLAVESTPAAAPSPAPHNAPARPGVVHLPQTVLARLALGAFPPGDLLSRLDVPPSDQDRQLLEILFPRRHPYLFPADRF